MVETGEGGVALIPAGISSGTYQTIRSLGRRDIGTICASSDRRTPAFASRYCGAKWIVPDPETDLHEYTTSLLDRIRDASDGDRPVRTVIPCREIDAFVLSKYRDVFEEHVSLVVPSLDTLRKVHDRKRLFDAAAKAGVPIPNTRLLTDVSEWDSPQLIKSRYNLLTNDYVDAHPPGKPKEVKRITHVDPADSPDVDAVCEEMGHVPIVQEFVPYGGKYMVAALYQDGEALSTFQHEQIRGDSYVGGGGVYRRSVHIDELETAATTLLDHLEWTGLACLEYIRDSETGEFKLLEINPRIWQSLPSTVHAGADFPYDYWLAATGRADEIDSSSELGVGTHMLYGELKYLNSIRRDDSPYVERPKLWSEIAAVAGSCVREPHFDFLALDDPRPFLRGVRAFLT